MKVGDVLVCSHSGDLWKAERITHVWSHDVQLSDGRTIRKTTIYPNGGGRWITERARRNMKQEAQHAQPR